MQRRETSETGRTLRDPVCMCVGGQSGKMPGHQDSTATTRTTTIMGYRDTHTSHITWSWDMYASDTPTSAVFHVAKICTDSVRK